MHTVAALSLLAAVATATTGTAYGTAYTTEVVTAYTTYCPYSTVISHGSQTITVTAPTTITITDCPCTITRPVTSSLVTSCSYPTSGAPYPSSNSTIILPPKSTPAGVSTVTAPPCPPATSSGSGSSPSSSGSGAPTSVPVGPVAGAGVKNVAGVLGGFAAVAAFFL